MCQKTDFLPSRVHSPLEEWNNSTATYQVLTDAYTRCQLEYTEFITFLPWNTHLRPWDMEIKPAKDNSDFVHFQKTTCSPLVCWQYFSLDVKFTYKWNLKYILSFDNVHTYVTTEHDIETHQYPRKAMHILPKQFLSSSLEIAMFWVLFFVFLPSISFAYSRTSYAWNDMV